MRIILTMSLLIILTGSVRAQSTNGLIAKWTFSGNAIDETGNGHDGTITGATLADDRFGNANSAYEFTGNDYLDIANDAVFNFGTGDFTVSLWVKSSSTTPGTMISKMAPLPYGGWNLWYNSDGKIWFTTGVNPNFTRRKSNQTVNDGQWHHVTFIRSTTDVNNWKIYIDGQENSYVDGTAAVTNITTTGAAYIGRRGTGNGFVGTLDDIFVYDRALTTSEVNELYLSVPSTPADVRFESITVATDHLPGGYKVSVDGKIIVEEVKVSLSESWPDYVFLKDYEMMTLEQLEQFIAVNGHLPGMKSAEEVNQDGGHSLAQMDLALLKKVEELTLYILQQQKEIESQKAMIQILLNKLEKISEREE